MTHRERMIAALNRKIPDRVPTFELEFQLTEELMGRKHLCEEDLRGLDERETQRKLKDYAAFLIRLYETLEHDAICLHYLSTKHIGDVIGYIRELSGNEFMILAHGDGTLAIPDGDGMYELSLALYETPDALHRKCRQMADDAIARDRYLMGRGIDGFILCSDYCFNQGPFLSPAMFAEFIAPYLKDIIAAIRAEGGWAIKHTDGNIMPIIDQLAACHPHALHSLDPMAGVDIRAVKERWGGQLALCGNVHCAAMQTGTEQDVISSAEYCLKYGKPGGGYIYCTSNIPFKGLPLERYQLVLDVWKKYRDY